MQIGQTIWAIDPCYDGSGENPRLTVGESYEVILITDDEIKIKNDFGRPHYFTFDKFDKYFSLTPPKEVKEGDKAEEIYHRFVQYEWNEVSEGMKKSILNAINEALKFNSQS